MQKRFVTCLDVPQVLQASNHVPDRRGLPGRRRPTQIRGSGTGEPRVRYVQLGTVAGDDISLRGDAVRGSGLELMGSGIGRVAIRELLAGARELLMETNKAGLDAPVTTLP